MPVLDGHHHYRIRSTGHSSSKYGPCEVCNQKVTEVHIQIHEQDRTIVPENGGETISGRVHCATVFGHESCLLSIRKGGIDFEIEQGEHAA